MDPSSFPLALSDADRAWQDAYLEVARGLPGADKDVAAATDAAVLDRLGFERQSLPDLDEDALQEVLAAASDLVRQALATIHAAELRLRTLTEMCRTVVLKAIDDA